MTPFKAVYGRDPPTIRDYISTAALTEDVALFLTDRQQILDQLQINLLELNSE